MTDDNPLEWGSHLPALMACLAVTKGPVLELGVGDYSTPALHAVCVSTGRLLISVEAEKRWHDRFRVLFGMERHEFIHRPYLDAINDLGHTYCAVVLLDQSPGNERPEAFRRLVKNADFIVVHDYWREIEAGIRPLLEGSKHIVLSSYSPPTLVSSATLSIPAGLL